MDWHRNCCLHKNCSLSPGMDHLVDTAFSFLLLFLASFFLPACLLHFLFPSFSTFPSLSKTVCICGNHACVHHPHQHTSSSWCQHTSTKHYAFFFQCSIQNTCLKCWSLKQMPELVVVIMNNNQRWWNTGISTTWSHCACSAVELKWVPSWIIKPCFSWLLLDSAKRDLRQPSSKSNSSLRTLKCESSVKTPPQHFFLTTALKHKKPYFKTFRHCPPPPSILPWLL